MGFTEEGAVMFDYVPMDNATEGSPNVMYIASNSTSNPLRVEECLAIPLVDINSKSLISLGTVGAAAGYLSRVRGVEINPPPSTPVTLIDPPKHGTFLVKPPTVPGGWPDYCYLADFHFPGKNNFTGKDRFTVRVDIDGESVELVTFVAVAKGDDDPDACNRTYGDGIWKIPPDKDVSLPPGLNVSFSDL
jgi:hypothetical protein